jgi:hypothetical protein
MNYEELMAEYRQLQKQRAELEEENLQLKQQLTEAQEQIAALQRQLFGPKAESLTPTQQAQLEELQKDLEAATERPVATSAEVLSEEEPAKERERSRRRPRQPLPEHLEEETVVLEPEVVVCPSCGRMTEKIGEQKYPGDFVPSPNWPNVAPGKYGPINALTPKYVGGTVRKFIAADPKPHILWIRGDSDMIVSDTSFFDMGYLGKLGYVPGWPGEEVYPPQPMVGQTRYVLEQYTANGGSFEEVVIADSGHTPYIDKPEEFMAAFTKILK